MLKRPTWVIGSMFLTTMIMALTTYGCSHVAAPNNQQPIEIISVVGPLQPINPGGPIVEITLKNVATNPVVSLSASLELGAPRPFAFNFDVTPSAPLQPDKSTSDRLTLIGGGFGDSLLYPLTISGTLQNGDSFVYTKRVHITPP